MTCCNGVGVNTSNDPSNCGSCGTVCDTAKGEFCVNGTCSCECGTLTSCGSECSCVDTSSNNSNCGASATMVWPDDEDRQSGRRVNFVIEFKNMVAL